MANNQLKEEIILSTGQFDKNINSVIRKVEDLRKKGSKVGDGFNQSLGTIIGKVAKLSGAFGVALGAGDVFNRMLKQSQTLGDSVARVQTQASEAVNFFASSLARADFSNFLRGLQDIITKAGEVADALDDLQSRQLLFDFTHQNLSAEYERQLLISKDLTKSEKERQQALQKAREISGKLSENEKDMAKHNASTAVKIVSEELRKQGKNVGNVDEGFIAKWFSYDKYEQRKKLKEEYDSYTKQAKDLEARAESSRRQRQKNELQNRGGFGGVRAMSYNSDEERMRKQAQALLKKRDSNVSRVIAWATSEIDDSTDSQLAQALRMMGSKEQLSLSAARREFQTNRSDARLNGGNKGSGRSSGKGGSTSETDYPVGSIAYYEELISQLNKEIKVQVDPSEIIRLQNELKEAKNQKDRLENADFVKRQGEVKNNTQLSGLGSLFDDKKIKEQIENFKPIITEQIKNFKPAIKSIREQFSDEVDKIGTILDAYDMGVIGADKAKELIDGINEQLLALGLKPVEVPIEIDKSLQKVNAIKDAFASLESVMSSMGQIFEEPLLDATGIIAQAVATYILGWTKATEQANALGPIGWAAFGLSTAAQMFAIVAQIKSAGAFANGGIIGGSSYSGDRLFARVNSGEMILNGSQQANLFSMLNGGSSAVGASNVNFVIRGSELHGVLKNYNGKMSKIR